MYSDRVPHFVSVIGIAFHLRALLDPHYLDGYKSANALDVKRTAWFLLATSGTEDLQRLMGLTF